MTGSGTAAAGLALAVHAVVPSRAAKRIVETRVEIVIFVSPLVRNLWVARLECWEGEKFQGLKQVSIPRDGKKLLTTEFAEERPRRTQRRGSTGALDFGLRRRSGGPGRRVDELFLCD